MILTHGANSLPRGGGGNFVNIGGRDYPYVKIGNQYWLAENLDWLYPGLELSTGAWSGQKAYTKTAKYYNDDPTYTAYDGSPIGLYYTAQAITSLASVLTDGWHVPTMSEINTLLSNAGTTAAERYEALFALNPYLRAMTGGDYPGTNSLGLNLHLNGKLDQSSFVDLNTTLGLPSKDITMTDYINYKRMSYVISSNESSWANSFTVRLVKNAPVNIGGRDYQTTKIGNKIWLAENLDFKFSGLVVGASGTSSSEPRGNYYNNDKSTYGVSGNKYGLLYNWIAVKYLEDNKATLLPPGWHVPSTSERDALAEAVGGASTAGTKLKSTTGWSSGAGTDDYGFSALPAGHYNGSFNNLGSGAYFFTANDSSNNGKAWRVDTGAQMNHFLVDKYYQFSVRLVKDV